MAKGVENTSALLRHLAFLGIGPLGRECWGRASLSISGLCCRDLPPAHCRQLTLPCPPSLSLHLPLNLQSSNSQHPFPAGPPWCFSSPCWELQLPVPVVTKRGTGQGAPLQLLLLPTGIRVLILLTERPLLTCSVVWPVLQAAHV